MADPTYLSIPTSQRSPQAESSREGDLRGRTFTQGNPSQTVIKIADFLHLNINQLSETEALDLCFSKIYDLCEHNEGAALKKIKDEVNKLKDSAGRTVMSCCIRQKNSRVFEELISQEICVDIPDENGNMPLHLAAQEGRLDFVKTLTEYNKIAEGNHLRQSPLHLAAFHGHADIVEYFLNRSPSLATQTAEWIYGSNRLKVIPLTLAVIAGHVECVNHFLSRGASLPRTEPIGSLLHVTIFFRQNFLLKYLLTRHSNQFSHLLEDVNERGQTPLMLAAYLGNVLAIQLLDEKKVNIDATDGEGNTALHWAVYGNNKNSATKLISLHANLFICNRQHREPDQLAFDIEATLLGNYLANLRNSNNNLMPNNLSFSFQPPENLAIKGGGPKTVAFLGAIEVLEGIMSSSLKRIAGTSGGAIYATLLAVDFRAKDIDEILKKMDLTQLLDHPLINSPLEGIKSKLIPQWSSAFSFLRKMREALVNPTATTVNIVQGYLRSLWHTTGICKGDFLLNLMEKYIRERTETEWCTFGELRTLIEAGKPFKHLHMFTTKIGPNPSVIHLSSEDPAYDNYIISHGVRASTSIPMVYEPAHLYLKVNGMPVPIPEYVCVDGGLVYNTPVEAFDTAEFVYRGHSKKDKNFPAFNTKTLAISLSNPPQASPIKDKPVETLKEFVESIMSVYLEAETLIRNINPYNKCRIIEISNCGVGLLEFNISEQKRSELIEAGKTGVKTFFQNQTDDILEIAEKPKTPELFDYRKTTPQEIGATKSGLYVHVVCNNHPTNNWIYYENKDNRPIEVRKAYALVKCPTCESLDNVALVACKATMEAQSESRKESKKFDLTQKEAIIIQPNATLKYLEFTIN